jgi:hypothetical protein
MVGALVSCARLEILALVSVSDFGLSMFCALAPVANAHASANRQIVFLGFILDVFLYCEKE